MKVTSYADIGGLERVSIKSLSTGKIITADVLQRSSRFLRVITDNNVTINLKRSTPHGKFIGRVGDMEFESRGTP